jgi:SAM-dependent methyltransferase
MASRPTESWANGNAYDGYIGRWSRPVAREFVDWLAIPPEQRWLDVGCGTGALTQTILDHARPASVTGVDPSPEYLAVTRNQIPDERAQFAPGTAQEIPERDHSFDAAVSGLVLNFVPEPIDAVREMARVVRPGGAVALYVWDYGESMQLLRTFWDAATALDPAAAKMDEGRRRFPICDPDTLRDLFKIADLVNAEVRLIQVPTLFRDFDDYWLPFLTGQGPAGGYVASLSPERRETLRERLRTTLPINADGTIDLVAGAWATRGTTPR